MKRTSVGLSLMFSICACVLLSGCAGDDRGEAPEVTFISAEKAAELWETAESREPVGERAVEQLPDEYGTTVVSRQAFRLGFPGRGPITLARCCSGSCVLTEGSTLSDCKTSGCEPSSDGCSPFGRQDSFLSNSSVWCGTVWWYDSTAVFPLKLNTGMGRSTAVYAVSTSLLRASKDRMMTRDDHSGTRGGSNL